MIGTSLPRRIRLAPNIELRAGLVAPSILVMHYTGMADAQRACDWLCSAESRVSCHYFVDEAGEITQMVDEEFRAWHAGVSIWRGEPDVNSHSIGIEVHNPGHGAGYPDFPAQQMQAVAALARDIVQRHAIEPRNVVAHSDIAPGRKIDPGEKFDWEMLAGEGVGRWLPPIPITRGGELKRGDDGEGVEDLQRLLKAYGYGIEPNGLFDPHTETVVKAFQRHFRPALIDGIADHATVVTLERLLLT